jgi:hypothetical protein
VYADESARYVLFAFSVISGISGGEQIRARYLAWITCSDNVYYGMAG